MVILSLNCGSSSVKYMLYDWKARKVLASGIVERVTVGGSVITHEVPGRDKFALKQDCSNHKTAIQLLLDIVSHPQHGVIRSFAEISAVGHRVVHGGEKFVKSVIISDETLGVFRKLSDLAPLHNPPNIMGIEAARELMPEIPHMAIMDTAWHQTMPKSSFLYALPYAWYEKYGIRRYGFHGTSFLYVAKRAAVLLGKDPFRCNLVIAHIGNGVSLNAVRRGVSYDTSMGFTPLEGMVMGTRSGDHDPAVPLYVMWKEGLGPKEMDSLLNKKSGILGITGKYTDRRDVIAAADQGDERCRLALEIESYRIRKYVGAYAAAVGGIDAVVFTAGVGEKAPIIRGLALEGLEYMGVRLDAERNELAITRNSECEISAPDSAVKVFVIPTDEERVFVEDVAALSEGRYDVHTNFKYRFQAPGFQNTMRDDAFAKECAANPRLREVACRPPVLVRA
ncbi:MAG: propionate kinase [Elusimicrobia bacterium GWA2_69_24]|nr:MAG: propionate kinase [Elusimicrobia bacterium GWA2_69_24]HBL15560.1 propionate kinase [Elusimicrobiota bacterium]